MKVAIPFLSGFEYALLSGKKTKTARTKRCGTPGDTFEAFGAEFMLDEVKDEALGVVATEFYKQEGCDSKLEFIAIWNSLHQRLGYSESQRVWLHTFHRVTA